MSPWRLVRRAVLLWVGFPFAVLGLVFLALGLWQWGEELAYRMRGAAAEAIVLDKTLVRANRQDVSRTRYVVAYRFSTYDGNRVDGSAEVAVEQWERLESGMRFPINYLTAEPNSNRPAGSADTMNALMFTVVGGGFLLLGGALMSADLIRILRALRVLRAGLVAEGTVVRTLASSISVNRVTQWRIHYRYRDELGRLREGVSHALSPGEAGEWKEGDRGTVRFDRERPEISLWLGRERDESAGRLG